MKNINKKESIIVYILANIGDFVWATSAISLIKQTNKNYKLAVITLDSYSPLIDTSLGIDDFIFFKKKYFASKNILIRYFYKTFSYFKYYFRIKKYKTIIFLDCNKMMAFFAKRVYRMDNIIGPNTAWCGNNIPNKDAKFYTQIVNMPKDSNITHMMLRYQIIIRSFLKTYNLALPILPNTSYLKKKVIEHLKDSNKYKVAFCLKGTNKLKFWEIDKWKNLVKELTMINSNITFFVLGSGKDQFYYADSLSRTFTDTDIRNLVNKTTLLELKEFLKQINLLISVDTGIAHIAAVSKVHTITLHGTSLPEQSMPINYNAKQICLYKDCSPCDYRIMLFNEVCNNNKCLNDIDYKIVLKEVRNILGF